MPSFIINLCKLSSASEKIEYNHGNGIIELKLCLIIITYLTSEFLKDCKETAVN